METSTEAKGILNMVVDKPAITLGAIGGITAGVAVAVDWLILDPRAKKGEAGAVDQKKMADTAKTIGLTLLGAAVIVAGIQMLKKKL